MINRLKPILVAAYMTLGLALTIAKVPGDLSEKYKLPAEVQAVSDAIDASQWLPLGLPANKKIPKLI